MQEERTEDILSICEVSLKNIEEKPFWYLCKYSITSFQSLAQGIMGNASNGTADLPHLSFRTWFTIESLYNMLHSTFGFIIHSLGFAIHSL